MKIKEDTETRFVIEDAPWGLALFLIALTLVGVYMVFHGFVIGNEVVSLAALVFAIGAPIAFAKAVRRGQLVLDNSARTAIWRVRDWRGLSVEEWALDGVDRVIVETRRDEGETRRLMLGLKGRLPPMPLTLYHSGLGNHRDIALRANIFLGRDDGPSGDDVT